MMAMSDETTQQSEERTGPSVSQEELDLAAGQENDAYMNGQLEYLQNRVTMLRVEANRLGVENQALRQLANGQQAEIEKLKKKPAARKPRSGGAR